MNSLKVFLSLFLCSLLVLCLLILGIITTLGLTILNPKFVASELDKIDVYSIIAEEISARIPIEGADEAIDIIVTDLKPWLKEQTDTVIYDGYAYLKGKRELNTIIPLEPLKLSLKENLPKYATSLIPPELAGVSEGIIETYLAQAYDEIETLIPEQFEITKASLGTELETGLEQAKQIVRYIKLAYIVALVFAAIFILLIAIVHRWRIKPLARSIGITFISAGIIAIIAVIIIRASNIFANLLPSNMAIPYLQEKLTPLFTKITSPLLIYGIVFLIAGIILVVLSILIKSAEQRKVVAHS